MNKIINWTIGSFFRTIGRIIAYIGIGLIIAYIFNNSDINWGIKDLFFDKVDALSITENVVKSGDGYFTPSNPNDYSRVTTDYIYNWSYATTNVVQWYYISSDNIPTQEHDYIEIPFILGLPSSVRETYVSTDYYCDKFQHAIDSMNNEYWECVSERGYNDPAQVAFSQNFSSSSIYASITYGDLAGNWAGWASCYIQNNNIVCPLQHNKTILSIRIDSRLQSNNQFAWYEIYLYRGYNFYKAQDIQGAINSQTQQQQQQHQEIMDDNTTQAESEATEFFEDFDAPDIGGLGAIITAPLNTIRSLLNSSCTNLVLPLPFVNENLTLPCMNTIYTQHFGAFFTIYQTIVLALIAYRCIRSIFFDIHGFTNPNDDRIEVMDL